MKSTHQLAAEVIEIELRLMERQNEKVIPIHVYHTLIGWSKKTNLGCKLMWCITNLSLYPRCTLMGGV